MGVIVMDRAGPGARCKCCGSPADTTTRFQGPGADTRVKVDLCPGCKGLLGRMLAEVEPGTSPDERPGVQH